MLLTARSGSGGAVTLNVMEVELLLSLVSPTALCQKSSLT